MQRRLKLTDQSVGYDEMFMSPREPDPDKRLAILEAATDAFASQGFAAVRIADIAKQAGIGKGTVYEYYRSKEDLLLAACLDACRKSEARMAALVGLDTEHFPNTDNCHPVRLAHEVMLGALQVVLGANPRDHRLFAELANASAVNPDLHATAKDEFFAKFQAWLTQAAAMHQFAVEGGYFRALPDRAVAARIVVAMVDGLIWQRTWLTDDDPNELARKITDTWLRMQLIEPERLEEFLQ